MPTATDNTDLWTPLPADVALLLRMRRNTRGSHEANFTADTDPTLTEVTGLVQNALDLITGRIGLLIPEAAHRPAKRVVALRAALSIEPGSRDFNEARMRELRAQYEEELEALVEAVQDAEDDGEIDPGDDGSDIADPIGYFPPSPCGTDHVAGTEIPYPACYEW